MVAGLEGARAAVAAVGVVGVAVEAVVLGIAAGRFGQVELLEFGFGFVVVLLVEPIIQIIWKFWPCF
jgi:hypothetical protein